MNNRFIARYLWVATLGLCIAFGGVRPLAAAVSAPHVKYFGYYDNGCGDGIPTDQLIREHRDHNNMTLIVCLSLDANGRVVDAYNRIPAVEAAGMKMIVAVGAFPVVISPPNTPVQYDLQWWGDNAATWQSAIDLLGPHIQNIAAIGIADEFDCAAPFGTQWNVENCTRARLRLEQIISQVKAAFPNTPAWVNYTSAYVHGIALPNAGARLGYQVPRNADWVSLDCYTRYEACFANESVDYLLDAMERTLSPTQRVVLIPPAFQLANNNQLSMSQITAIAEQYYQRSQADPFVIAMTPFIWRDVVELSNTYLGAMNYPAIAAKFKDIGKRIVGNRGTAGDYTADWNADAVVWRPGDGNWYVPGVAGLPWGNLIDVPVPGDYNGDGIADKAVWRPSDATWYVYGIAATPWGRSADIPVPGDYDGDGITDFAVFRPSDATWYIRNSRTGATTSLAFGLPTDIPVPADYNGDGKTDIAVWRPSDGGWHVNGIVSFAWGTQGDIPTPGDYDGDGVAELSVFRPASGTWHFHNLITGANSGTAFGGGGDIPVPADFNGDRKMDVAVWNPGNGMWSIQNQPSRGPWGGQGDIPVVNSVTTVIHAMGLVRLAPPFERCDLDQNGSTSVLDVQQCANQAIALVGCTTGDINLDATCNVVDVQRVVNNALGGPCVSP